MRAGKQRDKRTDTLIAILRTLTGARLGHVTLDVVARILSYQ